VRPEITKNELRGGWKPEQRFKAGDSVGGAESIDGIQMSRHEV